METMRALLSADYKPNGFVEAINDMPRGMAASEGFLKPDFQTYFLGLATMPIAVFVLCIVACILFLVAMLLRCCCWCVKCKPREMPETEQDKLLLIKRRTNKLITFLVFIAVIVVADHAGFWGMAKFNDGMKSIQDGMGVLKDNFNGLDGSVVSMSTSTDTLSYNMNLLETSGVPGCTSVPGSSLDSLSSGIDTLSGLTSAPGTYIEFAQVYIQQYAVEGKNSAYYIFYAILLSVAAMYLVALFFRSKRFMMMLLPLSLILTILLTLFYVVEWIVVTLFGDLCYDVTDNIVSAAPAGDLKDILRYYTQCAGTNPFDSPFDTVESAITGLENGFTTLAGTCNSPTQDGYIVSAQAAVASIKTSLGGINSAFECGPYMSAYDKMVEVGICDQGVAGMFVMWVCHIFLAWGISISMFTSTLVWQYFEPEYWNITKDTLYEKPPEQELEAIPVGVTHYADSSVQMHVVQHGHPPKHDSMI